MRAATIQLLIVLLASGAARAAMVTARWGVEGHVQYPATLTYENDDEGRTLIVVDLKALPRETTVHRARLFFERPGLYASGFEIIAAERQGDPLRLRVVGQPLELVAPYYSWFDATGAVRRWADRGQRDRLLFVVKKAPGFERQATCLEVAFDGTLDSPPPQVGAVKAFYRSGQVFITFREIEDYAAGRSEVTWGELSKRFRAIRHSGPVPLDEAREVRYRVYRADKPITRETICQADLVAEVAPGSAYNTRLLPGGDFIKRRPEALALRLAVEPAKPLPPGSGLFVHTVRQGGSGYYAVVTAVNGVENTLDFSNKNTTGPIVERRDTVVPVRQAIPRAHGHEHAGTSELRDGKTYQEDWYSYWAVPPNAPRPERYDFAVAYCRETMERPAPLTFTRGHTWGHTPEMPRPAPRRDVVMSMSSDAPNGFWTGINDARETLKGIEDGRWQPFTHNRQEALIRWAATQFSIDPQRIYSAIGAWGLWELRRADLYAYLHGWGMPEVTKGFQCWNWARGAWGPPEAYESKPADENPFHLQDYSRWVLEDPSRELPYLYLHTGWGAHFTEMGWPPFPRFARAMMASKQAFAMQAPALRAAIDTGIIEFRRDESVPAFGNCSLDDNIGSGELKSGVAFGQVNGYLVWESRTIVDEPGLYGITVYLWSGDSHGRGAAPLAAATVDLTPRKCQKFRLEPGAPFTWTNIQVADGEELQLGRSAADRYGLATITGLRVTKGKHRITFRRE